MTILPVATPIPIFNDIDGQPLESGEIFIGVAGLDPITNPTNVYWNAALTQLATQPISTRGGYPLNNGTVGRLYIGNDYSIKVVNRVGNVIHSTASNGITTVSTFSAGTTGLMPSTPTAGPIVLGGTLAVANGGTGAATLTGVVKGNGTAAFTAGSVNLASEVTGTLLVANGGTGQTSYTNGQLLIGNTTGNTLTKATLTAGSGVTITNGSGSITIAAAGMPTLNVVTGTTQAATASNHYVLTNVAATTVTLPGSPSAGDVVWVTVGNGLTTNVVARNGNNIQSLAEDLTLNATYAAVQMRYINATIGWTFV
jgi:hypothetical protein